MSHSETAAVSDHWSTPEPTIQFISNKNAHLRRGQQALTDHID